jgi:hypothetical protein
MERAVNSTKNSYENAMGEIKCKLKKAAKITVIHTKISGEFIQLSSLKHTLTT